MGARRNDPVLKGKREQRERQARAAGGRRKERLKRQQQRSQPSKWFLGWLGGTVDAGAAK